MPVYKNKENGSLWYSNHPNARGMSPVEVKLGTQLVDNEYQRQIVDIQIKLRGPLNYSKREKLKYNLARLVDRMDEGIYSTRSVRRAVIRWLNSKSTVLSI